MDHAGLNGGTGPGRGVRAGKRRIVATSERAGTQSMGAGMLVKDLEALIRKLQARFGLGTAPPLQLPDGSTLVIEAPPATAKQIAARPIPEPPPTPSMSTERFWELIGSLRGRANEANCRRLDGQLAKLGLPAVFGFAEHLAAALYELDTRLGADQLITDPTDPAGR